MKCPQRVTEVAVIAGLSSVRGRRIESVRGVIVKDQNGATVRIVCARMSPVERPPDHDGGKDRGKSPSKQTITRHRRPHLYRL